jgi:hypothetical protein
MTAQVCAPAGQYPLQETAMPACLYNLHQEQALLASRKESFANPELNSN